MRINWQKILFSKQLPYTKPFAHSGMVKCKILQSHCKGNNFTEKQFNHMGIRGDGIRSVESSGKKRLGKVELTQSLFWSSLVPTS